jgi:hypothetical protein
VFSTSKFNDTIALIQLGKEDEFILWMMNSDDKKINELNIFLTSNKVNLLDYLFRHSALKALNYAISRHIPDIPGKKRYGDETTALLEKATFLPMLIEENKELAKRNIVISKKLIDHGSNVNFIAPPSRFALQNLQPDKTSYKGLMGKTILMSYAWCGCTEMVKYVLEHGGNKSINVRDYCSKETEAIAIVAPHIPQTDEGYRFDTALSIAFASNQANDGEIIKLLLDHGADVSLFYDNEFYRPILFAAVAEFDSTTSYVRPECRTKVEIILKKMEEENLHLTVCKETYHIFSEMLSEHGYRYKQRMCTLV